MAGQVFIVTNPPIFGGDWKYSVESESTLVIYRSTLGGLSFFADEEGRAVLDCLLSGSCAVTSKGKLIQYGESISAELFIGAIASRSGVSFYGPDLIFYDEVEKLAQYDEAKQKLALYKKYGRQFDLPQQPILEWCEIEGQINQSSFHWALAHCRALSLWRCVTGASPQPVIFGADRQSKIDAVASLCGVLHVELIAADGIDTLPNW